MGKKSRNKAKRKKKAAAKQAAKAANAGAAAAPSPADADGEPGAGAGAAGASLFAAAVAKQKVTGVGEAALPYPDDRIPMYRTMFSAMGKQEWWWIMDDTLAEVGTALRRNHFAVLDGFLGGVDAKLATTVRGEVRAVYEAGLIPDARQVMEGCPRLEPGALAGGRSGHGLAYVMQPVRGDHVAWFGGDEPACRFKALPVLLQRVDTLVSELAPHVPELRGVKNRTKAMLTCYPGGGARYVRHCDTTRGGTHNGRILTALYYANGGGWSAKDGGELRIFSPMNSTQDPVVERATLPPLGDRLVIFWSDNRVPHEVLAAHFQRFACTLWYFDERLRGAALDEASVGDGGGGGGGGAGAGAAGADSTDLDEGGEASVAAKNAGDGGGGESAATSDAKEREQARIRREIARYEAKYGVKAKVYKDYDTEGASAVKPQPAAASGGGNTNTNPAAEKEGAGGAAGISTAVDGATPTPAPRTPPPTRTPEPPPALPSGPAPAGSGPSAGADGGHGGGDMGGSTSGDAKEQGDSSVAAAAPPTPTNHDAPPPLPGNKKAPPAATTTAAAAATQVHKDWRGSADVWELD